MAVNAIVHNWNVLRGVLTCDKYCDLKLVTENNESIKVHKVVLTAVSKKVKSALAKNDTSEIVVRNVKCAGLRNVIDFIYNGRVEIKDTDALLDFADTYALLQVDLGPKVNKTVQDITVNQQSDSSQDAPTYTCSTCQKTFSTKTKYARHMREVHEKMKVMKEKVAYSCEQCGEVYTSMRNVTYCPCKTRKRKRGSDEVQDQWDRCLYQCAVCSCKYADRRVLRSHVIQTHNMDYKVYLEQFGDPEVACPKWQCLICRSSIKFARSSIEAHTRHLHRLTLADYEAKYGVPPENEEGSNDSTESHDGWSTAGDTMDPQHTLSDTGDTAPAPTTDTTLPFPTLAVREVNLPGSSSHISSYAWLPVPSYQHNIGQTMQANVEKGLVKAVRSQPVPALSKSWRPPILKAFTYQPPRDMPPMTTTGEPTYAPSQSQTVISNSPQDSSDLEEFQSSSEML